MPSEVAEESPQKQGQGQDHCCKTSNTIKQLISISCKL